VSLLDDISESRHPWMTYIICIFADASTYSYILFVFKHLQIYIYLLCTHHTDLLS